LTALDEFDLDAFLEPIVIVGDKLFVANCGAV
jgi:hypothetical protein